MSNDELMDRAAHAILKCHEIIAARDAEIDDLKETLRKCAELIETWEKEREAAKP